MKWHRQITSAFYAKKDPQSNEPKNIRVYSPACGWGELTEFSSKGDGYIKFDSGGGQLVRNWEHFLDMVEKIDTGDGE